MKPGSVHTESKRRKLDRCAKKNPQSIDIQAMMESRIALEALIHNPETLKKTADEFDKFWAKLNKFNHEELFKVTNITF